ncbi:MAG: protein kinase [Chloroflexi bacterium]|nr:protein kinase [Chloroflexota bacterium]
MEKFIIANRFEINDLEKDLLGRGGMGVVYRATDNQSGETVAVKTLNSEALSHEPNILERFQREGDALRQLNHPNIVKFITAIESHGQHYLVMEFVDGGSLQSLLAKHGQLSSQRSVEIGLDLADALTRAHHLGIVYRDLKPANVLLAQDGTPRLTDFGIAQLADSSRLTQTGVLVGTVNYLSPEALSGEVLDFRTDIWAFGVLMFEMLTGRLPFTGDNLTARITATLTQPVPDLTRYDLDIPKPLADLIYHMLEKDRQQRIPSMRQVGAELESLLNGWQGNPISSESRFESPSLFTQNANHELPTGTVTFLFTDIEGSTKLAQKFPDAIRALIARHNEILTQVFESQHGYIFQIIGDSFAAAFHNANDAVNAALEAQRKLHNEAWAPAPIKVRMGIHTGAAQLQIESKDTPYSGYATLALTQRISSAGHGGQILISSATENLSRGQLPKDAALRDMGEKNLKDIFLSERIYQLNVPDLPSEFPALKTYEKTRHNLPLQLTTFIGREKEVEQIKKRLEKNHLVTLTGSGGIGKTRLSIQVASELLPEYPIGVWLVELAPLTNPALVPQSVCAALGVTPEGNTSALDALINYMRTKKILLVVDNCEHLIDACAQLCDSLLHACADLRIIASSREALGIEGENAYRVPSLSLPNVKSGLRVIEGSEAVKLFMERATTMSPEFGITEANAPAIAQICLRLDGIALAIELAASRVKMLKVEQIATRLDDAFRLLTGGSRTALPRQQTLRALIDWSYNLLPDEEKTFLRRLSVFMGGWTLEAAEAICGNADALDLLTHLVDKSLVSVDYEHGDETRYYLLETVRQYAREKLVESGESEFARERHLEYYMLLAEANEATRKTPEQMLAYQQMKMELDNFRLALGWSLGEDTNNHFCEKGLRLANSLDWEEISTEEGLNWLQKGLSLISNDDPMFDLTRARTMTYLGRLFVNMSESQYGIDLLEKSLAIYQSNNPQDKSDWVNTLLNFAYAYIDSDLAKVRAYAQQGVAMARSMGKVGHWDLGWALYWDGCAAYRQTEYETAKSQTQEGLAIFRQLRDNISVAGLLQLLGWIEMDQKNYDAARAHLSQAQSIYSSLGLKSGIMLVLGDIASLDRSAGRFDAARICIEEVVAYERDRGLKKEMIIPLWRLGDVLVMLGEFEQATKALRESLQLVQYSGDPRFKGYGLFSLAKVLKHQGDFNNAARLLGAIEVESSKDLWQLYAPRMADYNQNFEAIKTALGESAFAAAYAEGKAMTLEQAVSYALELTI